MATSLGGLIVGLYGYAQTIIGLCVFVMFLLAGLSFIIPGLSSIVGKPKDIFMNAVIGTFLLFSAYVILNTINPDLVDQRETGPEVRTFGQ